MDKEVRSLLNRINKAILYSKNDHTKVFLSDSLKTLKSIDLSNASHAGNDAKKIVHEIEEAINRVELNENRLSKLTK